jgi:predicted alpha/beta-hydrolase family hydrolase
MYSYKTLEIKGHRNELVPNTLLWQERQARQVAIVLPGIGYTCHMPLLYYASQSLLTLGMDVLWVEYNYIRRDDYRALSGTEQNQWFFEDVTAACRIALAQRSYREITLVGKSMGTRAMAHLIATDARLTDCRDVWLTPVLRDATVREQIKSRPHPLVVIGTADPYYDSAYLAGLGATGASEVMVVDGADHSMEIKGDVESSLMILQKITRAIKGFQQSTGSN